MEQGDEPTYSASLAAFAAVPEYEPRYEHVGDLAKTRWRCSVDLPRVAIVWPDRPRSTIAEIQSAENFRRKAYFRFPDWIRRSSFVKLISARSKPNGLNALKIRW